MQNSVRDAEQALRFDYSLSLNYTCYERVESYLEIQTAKILYEREEKKKNSNKGCYS